MNPTQLQADPALTQSDLSSSALEQASSQPVEAPDQQTFTVFVRDVSVRPRILLFENFITEDECEGIISLAAEKMRPSQVVDPEHGDEVPHPDRTSRGTHFQRDEIPLLTAIEHRVAALTQIPFENGEGLQVLNYGIGQLYRPHWDYFDPAIAGSKPNLARGGQRVATMLMYLNHVEEGGDTSFPNIGLKVMPRKGSALLFYNVTPDGEPEPLSLHGADPVYKGEKWVMTKWLREAPFV